MIGRPYLLNLLKVSVDGSARISHYHSSRRIINQTVNGLPKSSSVNKSRYLRLELKIEGCLQEAQSQIFENCCCYESPDKLQIHTVSFD